MRRPNVVVCRVLATNGVPAEHDADLSKRKGDAGLERLPPGSGGAWHLRAT